MSNYIVDGADLTSVANAIRTKGGTSASLAFPAGFVSAIGDIPTGGGAVDSFFNGSATNGVFYTEDMIAPADTPAQVMRRLTGAAYMKSFLCKKSDAYGGSYDIREAFKNCPLLESVTFLNGVSASGYCEDVVANCPNLKTFTTGGIGYPNTVGMGSTSGSYMMFRNITTAFDIIIYANASTLADVPAILKTGSPWGATNATVIYKSSVTGEVLT